jgi:hypothetical protein
VSGDQPPPPGSPPPREQPPPGAQPPPAQQQPPPWGATGWEQLRQPTSDWQQGAWPSQQQQQQQHGYPSYPTAPGYPTYPGYPGQPVALPVAHKPGAIPLRPLTLNDFFDGAFRIIRYNPKATIGAAVLVSAVAMVVPIVISLLSGSTGGINTDPGSGTLSDSQVVDLVWALGGLFLGSQLQAIGLLYVSGMIAHVTSAAAVGRRLSIGEAWAATAGKRWRLLGMSLLLGLVVVVAFGVVAGVLVIGVVAYDAPLGAVIAVGLGLLAVLVVCYLWFWVRVRALAVPTLMLEPVGVFGALARAVRLTRGQFWRLFGLLLLVSLVVAVVGGVLQLPFNVVSQVFLTTSADDGHGLLLYLLVTGVGTVISSAVVQPFEAAVSALLYVDQRIRKEAYDVELLGRAGILPA